MPLQQENQNYTYADYLLWKEEERIEIYDGIPVMQSAPSTAHQRICRNLFRQLDTYLTGRPCEAFFAPFSVRLGAKDDDSDQNVFEPDIVVICNQSKVDGKGCKGAPDLIIEIMSPSTARYDRIVKLGKYQRAGVREYWVVDPDTETVQVCILENGLYFVQGYVDVDTVPVGIFADCNINLSDVFAE